MFFKGTYKLNFFLASRKNDKWYLGGISAEIQEKKKTITFKFLTEGVKYKLTLIGDGIHDKKFTTGYFVVDSSSSIEVKMLRRCGFAAELKPII